jgi:hypothetical protein
MLTKVRFLNHTKKLNLRVLFSVFSAFLGSQTGFKIIVLLFFKHGLRRLLVFSLNPMFGFRENARKERKKKKKRVGILNLFIPFVSCFCL